MIFLNFRRIFLTVLFIMGAGTLLLGYSGLSGLLLKGYPGVEGGGEPYHARGGSSPAAGEAIIERPAPAAVQESASGESFFVDYRLQRERARGQQIELLRDIAGSPSSAADTRQLAQEQLLGLSKNLAVESRLENLLRAKGYRDAVVSLYQKGVTVVIESGRSVSPSEESGIVELVSKETGIGEQGITVIPKK